MIALPDYAARREGTDMPDEVRKQPERSEGAGKTEARLPDLEDKNGNVRGGGDIDKENWGAYIGVEAGSGGSCSGGSHSILFYDEEGGDGGVSLR